MGRNTPKCHILACSNTHFFNFNLSLFFLKYQGSDEASDCSHFNTEVPVLQSTVVQAQIMSSTCLATRSLEVTGTEGSSGNSHRLDGVNLVKSKSSSPSTANALWPLTSDLTVQKFGFFFYWSNCSANLIETNTLNHSSEKTESEQLCWRFDVTVAHYVVNETGICLSEEPGLMSQNIDGQFEKIPSRKTVNNMVEAPISVPRLTVTIKIFYYSFVKILGWKITRANTAFPGWFREYLSILK